jgi:tetratricopeptide (TPR) repeat protein
MILFFGFLCAPLLLSGAAISQSPETTDPGEQRNALYKSHRLARAKRYFSEGEKLMQDKSFRSAATKFKMAIRQWPSMAEAHSNLGYCKRKQKLYNEAIEAYLEAIRLDPALVEAREYLAEAYIELAQQYREKAIDEIEILWEIGPKEAREVEAFMQKLDL